MSEQLVLYGGQDPSQVCRGVWINEVNGFIPVDLNTEPYVDPHFGYTLYEYSDAAGIVRASLLDIPTGGTTPAWHIKQPNLGYLEVHRVVSGRGTIIIQPREGDYTRSGYHTDGTGTQQFDVRSAMHELEPGESPSILIKPGETFQVIADKGEPLQILAVMPKEPFKLEFEERVGSLL